MITKEEERFYEKRGKAHQILKDSLIGFENFMLAFGSCSDFGEHLESLSILINDLVKIEKEICNPTNWTSKSENPYAPVEKALDEWIENYE